MTPVQRMLAAMGVVVLDEALRGPARSRRDTSGMRGQLDQIVEVARTEAVRAAQSEVHRAIREVFGDRPEDVIIDGEKL